MLISFYNFLRKINWFCQILLSILSIDNFTSMLAFAYPAYMYMTVLPMLANCQSIFCVLVEARRSLVIILGDLWFHGVLYVLTVFD